MSDARDLYAALDDAYEPPAADLTEVDDFTAAARTLDATRAEPAVVRLFPPVPDSTRRSAGDPGELTLEGAEQLRAQFEANPEAVLAMAQRAFDETLTAEQLRLYLDRTVAALRAPSAAADMLTATRRFREATAELPPDFGFEGYDAAAIPVDYENTQFESAADWLGWVIYSGPRWITEGLAPERYPFRSHAAYPSAFHYAIPDDGEIALFSDFGTHLYHSRYIARHIASLAPHTAIHLGDVYYAGKPGELRLRFINDLAGVVARTELFTLAGNHEMYSAGIPFMQYIDDRHDGVRQRQEGGYFSLSNATCQIIGMDTQYYGGGRYRNAELLQWLRERLEWGRRSRLTNIVVSSDNPYRYGRKSTSDLFGDMAGLAGGIDLWFWGNTHYCALFSAGSSIPFIGSCIGHGGYPYGVERYGGKVPDGMRVLFLETRSRFHKWPQLRPDRGNNGFCTLRTDTSSIELRYIDWMKNLRCTAILRRAADGKLTVGDVTEHP